MLAHRVFSFLSVNVKNLYLYLNDKRSMEKYGRTKRKNDACVLQSVSRQGRTNFNVKKKNSLDYTLGKQGHHDGPVFLHFSIVKCIIIGTKTDINP